MADLGSRMNFTALKRADPYAKEIIDSATHVALYTFVENEWEKTTIEGALFVYSRNGEPYHSLLIMNRLNTNNLIEPISKGIEIQVKEPFLLYKNAKSDIFGIWFYDKDECARVATKMSGLLMKPSQKQSNSDNVAVTSSASSNAPVDIFTMLSKAQDDFNSNKGVVANKCESTPSRAPDMASQSVMDFFAKAGGGAAVQMPPVSSLPSPGIFGPRSTDAREVPQLLQRLMSNPAHSVEHIEKQQRSVTPQDGQNTNGNISLDNVMRQNCGFQLKSTPNEKQKQQQRVLSMKMSHGLESCEVNGLTPLENDLNMMHLSSPKQSSPLATYLNQSQDVNHAKPALMPPTMFTTMSTVSTELNPEPLTRNQLLQAFNYLLKHDADFVNKLHEGYVKSFSEKPYSGS